MKSTLSYTNKRGNMGLLSKLVSNKIAITNGNYHYANDGLVYKFSEDSAVSVKCGPIDITADYSIDEFEFVFVKARDHLERQSRLIITNGGARLGWVFPISTLITREEVPDDKWAKTYAKFAVYASMFKDEVINNAKYPEELSGEFSISDFYSLESAIVVLGKKAMSTVNISLESINLMLVKYGYFPYQKEIDTEALIKLGIDYNTTLEQIDIRKSSDNLENLNEKFQWILSRAIIEENSCSCFFAFYQIIEAMLSIVFEVAIKSCSEDERLFKDPWSLKEKLAQVSNEKWRLDSLLNRFVKPALDKLVLEQLNEKCNEFLLLDDYIKTPSEKPELSLYLVRNKVVHRQIELTNESLQILKNINYLFLELCYELIEKFNLETGRENLLKSIEQSKQHA